MALNELEYDKAVNEKVMNFRKSIDNLEKIVATMSDEKFSENFEQVDRLNYDLFSAYLMNTLYWCYLRTKGLDPNAHKVVDELQRVRKYMIDAKQAIDRHTIRPTLNKPVAQRFIKHGVAPNASKRKHKDDNDDDADNDQQQPAAKKHSKHTK